MENFWESVIVGFCGVIIGVILTIILFSLILRFEKRRDNRRRSLELKVKEIETLQLLNKKLYEILQKRTLIKSDSFDFNAFDDVLITFDDYAYLRSFTAQNNFYLPSYIVEEFFQNILQRQIALTPEENLRLDGYSFKEGKIVLENFADEIKRLSEEKKQQLKKLSKQPVHLILRETV